MSYKRQDGQSWSCITCGALVDNTSQHDAFHRDFTSLVELVTNIRPVDKVEHHE